MSSKKISTWDIIVHTPFRKVVKFDLICMGIGAIIGASLTAAILLS